MNTTMTDTRIIWDSDELAKVARALVEERKTDPHVNIAQLINPAIRKALPESRHRDINTINAVPALKSVFEKLWLEEVTRLTPDPVIVHVETQAPPDYVTLLGKLDTPSLAAMLLAKLGKEWETVKPLLGALNGNGHVGAPLNPPVSLLAAASPKSRRTRVLVCGPFAQQFHEIEQRVADEKIPVELLWLDKDKSPGARGLPISADYVVATEFIRHHWNDAFKKAVPPGKYFFLQGTGITAVVNKIRDIGTLTPPKA